MSKDTFIVEGLAGKKTLNGEVSINGAKNAVLKAMAASVLFQNEMTIKNVPFTEDVKKLSSLLSNIGAKVTEGKRMITIDPTTIVSQNLDTEMAKSMRASVVLTGPLLARFGKVIFPAPGGCVIGARPIDLFVDGYQKMGAKVELVGENYVITAPKDGGQLKGAEIFFNIQTVGGTETLMMAAVLADGKTVLKNCAMEPEIVSLAQYLKACGAKISGAGTPVIEIEGLGRSGLLNAKKAYTTIPDRIEAGSFLLLGALCADNLKITDCDPTHLEVLVNMLRQSGVNIETTKNTIEIKRNGAVKNSSLKSFNVRTHEYPGFPTDLQSPMVTYLTQVSGESIVFETIYEGRFKFVQNLEKLGAGVKIMNPREILVKGVDGNSSGQGGLLKAVDGSEPLDSFDIRAGFATVMAGLVSRGTSVIQNIHFIDRGYESLEVRLAKLGANIRRVSGGGM